MAITTDARRQLGRVKQRLRDALSETPAGAPAEAPPGPALTPGQQAQWRDEREELRQAREHQSTG